MIQIAKVTIIAVLLPALVFETAITYASEETASPAQFSTPLPAESIPSVASLPTEYPDTWVFAHDMSFGSLLDGKVLIVDVAAETRNFKGMIGAGMMGQFQPSRTSSELYTGQTMLSRRTYGERTDLVIIFDKSSLLPIDEIALPPKRQQIVTQPNSFQLTDNGEIGLVMNFTPAASVSVVNLKNRQFLQEIPLPGCNLLYPTGQRGFSSFCADGSMVSFALNADGTVKGTSRSDRFIDIQADPLYAKSAVLDGITYFLSYQGRIQPIDMRKPTPNILADWSFVPKELKVDSWLPSGWQVLSARNGELYVLMDINGKEGSHKTGGSEVWVLDIASKKLDRRIALPAGGVSLTVTRSDPAYLVVTNGGTELNVFDSASGKHLRDIHLGMSATPFVLYSN